MITVFPTVFFLLLDTAKWKWFLTSPERAVFISAGVQTAADMNEKTLISLSVISETVKVLKEDWLKFYFLFLLNELKERSGKH